MTGVTHPPYPARKAARLATSWWGKAWVRAIEEAVYAEGELRAGRALARSAAVGGITVATGTLVAAVTDRGDLHAVRVRVPVLEPREREALVEVVAAESGRIAALLAGELPHPLVEHAEDAGVELLPYGGELDASCTCDAWTQPCAHAVAVLAQTAWLLDADPLVLLRLRGLPRDELLAELHAREEATARRTDQLADDLDTAADAAARAARVLALLDDPAADDPGSRIDHLF